MMRQFLTAVVLCVLASCAGAAPALTAPGGSMNQTTEARHVSVSISRSPDEVYRFARQIERWPEWAQGLGTSVQRDGDAWIARGPLGEVKVRFADDNAYRVLDHD